MTTRLVTRPAIPVVVWGVVSLYAGILLAERISWAFALDGSGPAPVQTAFAALGAALLGTVVLVVSAGRSGAPTAVMFAATLTFCALLGLGIGSVRWHGWQMARGALEAGPPGSGSSGTGLTGVVVRDPVAGRFGWTAIVTPADARRIRIRVMIPAEGPVPRLGEVLIAPERPGPLPLDEEWSRRAHQRVEAGSVRVRAPAVAGWSGTPSGRAGPVRAAVAARVERVGGVGGDLLQGILLGDRTRLRDTPAEEDMRVCGLSHLMAVSGTHLGIVALVVARVVARARRGLWARVFLVCAATIGYVVLTGVQPSALRALGMGTVAGVAALSGRRGDGVAALAVAAGGMLVADPAVAFDVGFRLSVCAVAGLVLFAPLATSWTRQAIGNGAVARRFHPLADMVALTIVAQAATAPVAIPAFGMFSLIAPAANAVALPLLTLALGAGLGAAAAGFAVEPLATPLLSLAALPLRVVAGVAGRMALVPGAAIGVDADPRILAGVALALLTAAWVLWPVPRGTRLPRLVVLALLAATLAGMTGLRPPSAQPLLTVLDVGQGDAVVIRDGGSTLLIDTGPDPGVLRSALTRAGIRRLDSLVLTHDHADHTGGVAGIVGVARVSRVFGPVVAEEDAFASVAPVLERLVVHPAPGGGMMHALRAGDVLTVGSTRLEVLWPRAPDPSLSTNDTSVVLHLRRGGFSALIAGDAEDVVWDALQRDGEIPDVDLVVVPHHGSANGLTAEALEKWSPAVAMISVGEGNDFGHPAPATCAMLEESGAAIVRTDLHGDLEIFVRDSGGFRLRTSARGGGLRACATIPESVVSLPEGPGAYGRITAYRPQVDVRDTRDRRPAARAGRGPPQEAALIGG